MTICSFVFGFKRIGIWMLSLPCLISWYHHVWIVFNDKHYYGIKKYFHVLCSFFITLDLILFTFGYVFSGFSLGAIVLISAIVQRIRVMRNHTNIVEKAETCTTIVPLVLILLMGFSLITMFIDSRARLDQL